MSKVEAYQVAAGPSDPSWGPKWTEATFYIGVMAAYNTTKDSQYLTDATTWATKNKYTLTGSPTTDANAWCAGQVYADLYFVNPTANASDIASCTASFNAANTNPLPSFKNFWYWCDALFMAPGLVARLGAAAGSTGQAPYFNLLDTEWKATQTELYDPANKLFWRDSSFVNSKVYWSRGNGWVMAGTARVLEYLPKTDASYSTYTTLLTNMASAVAPLQGTDGLWRPDLLNSGTITPDPNTNPETSGTGLMTFAIAWGINNGILDSATYLPVVTNAWEGLVSCVNSSGMLEYVQPTGSEPALASQSDTNDYGVGAFLLAGSEVSKLQ
jgi:rhamnogalacturonyl hydrolase YesR